MQHNVPTAVTAYDVLGVPYDADQKDIHAALRKLALAWHPDRVPGWRRGEATLRFQAVMDAYAKVRTPELRASYNETLKTIGTRTVRKRIATGSNDNMSLGIKARAWLKALETVFWPVRKEK
ncbi:MAG: J domain-containing protein [Alphaproteobacteria bacterium]|nr:J domain-containing protein [Alphaproteobacteria bacterium]